MKTFWEAFWDRLSKRQQLALYIGGGVVLVLLIVQFLVLPFFEAKKAVRQAIRNNEKILGDITLLAKEQGVLKRRVDRIQQALASRPPNFALFSQLEKVAGDAGVKSNIKNINATKGMISGPYEEMPVEIRLEKVTLKQLTDFLYLLEAPQDLIRIKKISIGKMKESPEYLVAQIQVTTFQMAKTSG